MFPWDAYMWQQYASNKCTCLQPVVKKHINQQLDDGEWLDAVIWDKEKPNPAYLKIDLDLNDPNMLFDCEQVEAAKTKIVEAKQVKKGRKPLPKPLPKVSEKRQ